MEEYSNSNNSNEKSGKLNSSVNESEDSNKKPVVSFNNKNENKNTKNNNWKHALFQVLFLAVMFYFSFYSLKRKDLSDQILFEKPDIDCYELKTDNNVKFYILDKFYKESFSKFSQKEKNDFAKEIEIHYLSYLKNNCSESLRIKDDFEYKIKHNIGDKTDLINKLSNLQFNSCDEYKELSRILKR